MEDTLYIGEYLSEKLSVSLQSPQKYNYLLLLQNQNWYLLHVDISQNDGMLQVPQFVGSDKKCEFVCSQDKQMILKQKIEKVNDQQIHRRMKNMLVLNLRVCAYKGHQYQIIGYKYNKNIVPIQELFAQAKDVHSKAWNIYHEQYLKNSKMSSKSKATIISDIIPITQFCISVILSPKQIQSNSFSQKSMFSFNLLIALDTPNLLENIKLTSKITEELIAKNIQQNYKNAVVHQYFSNVRFSPVKIFNPHVYLKPVPKQKYELFLVKGVYEYYHYDDQNFNDRGWGCAYRAFQTLLSWLHIQGYTKPMEKMISILEIQENIDKFDRSRRLKGKSDWIGATQISWLVPKMTKPEINCKIQHLSDGKQVLDKCEQFKHHFLTSGCPIMYGGGQYAYSIVGMYYNWKLGECEFLILDPHYTGEDEYGKIIEKKGLAWRKPEEMFKKGVFYNFCMPIIK